MTGTVDNDRVGFSRRFKATALDTAVILAVGLMVDLFYRRYYYAPADGAASGLILPDLVIFFGVVVVYALIEGLLGQSPGKVVTHIAVRTADGKKAEVFTLLFRSFLKYSMFMVPLIVAGTFVFMKMPTPALVARYTQTLMGMIMIQLLVFLVLALGVAMFNGCFMVLTQNRQSLHDRLAGTAVYPSLFARPE